MKQHFKRGAAALLAMLVVVSMMTGGGMAAVGYDNETTNTATTSDIQGGETITSFNASTSDRKFIEITSDSSDPKLEVIDNDTGEVVETFDSNHSAFEVTDSTNGHYAWNVTYAQLLGDVPVDANGTTTVDIKVYETETADTPNATATVTLEATNERTVVRTGESFTNSNSFETGQFIEVAGFNIAESLPVIDSADKADIEQDNVAVDGDNTTVTYVLDDANASDPFDAAADSAGAEERLESQLWINGNPHAIYAEGEVPSDVDSNATYGVYDATSDEVTIHVGDDYADQTSLDVHMVGNDDYGLVTHLAEFGFLSDVSMPSLGSGMLMLSTLPLAARTRAEV